MLFCCENNLYAMGTAMDRSSRRPISSPKRRRTAFRRWPSTGWTSGTATPRAAGRRSRPRHGRAVLHRVPHLRFRRALDVRPGAVPGQGRSRASGATNMTHPHVHRSVSARPRLSEADVADIEMSAAAEIAAAVAYAEAGTWEDVADLERERADTGVGAMKTTYRTAVHDALSRRFPRRPARRPDRRRRRAVRRYLRGVEGTAGGIRARTGSVTPPYRSWVSSASGSVRHSADCAR